MTYKYFYTWLWKILFLFVFRVSDKIKRKENITESDLVEKKIIIFGIIYFLTKHGIQ